MPKLLQLPLPKPFLFEQVDPSITFIIDDFVVIVVVLPTNTFQEEKVPEANSYVKIMLLCSL